MTDICFYFQVHQPFRLRPYSYFDIGAEPHYFDDASNAHIVRRVAEKCYLPMNDLLLRAIERTDGAFRCAFSISGTALDQYELWSPETLASFGRLAETGCVEFLAETSHHSLAFLDDEEEFGLQILAHCSRIDELFGAWPTTFRNTELVCSNAVSRVIEDLGFQAILGEGADHLLGWRSPHYTYRPAGCERITLLLRAYRLSDDIAFRFSNRNWDRWPLRAETFGRWLGEVADRDEPVVGLFMDYETFGEHQWADTGIFEFMEHLPVAVTRGDARLRFRTPSEVAAAHAPAGELDLATPVSWADSERDLTAWLGNAMQRAAHQTLYALAPRVREAARTGAPELLASWRRLTTSDHVYYMCTKFFADGDVHEYFSPYDSPHDAFIAFMNVIEDLEQRVGAHESARAGVPARAQGSA